MNSSRVFRTGNLVGLSVAAACLWGSGPAWAGDWLEEAPPAGERHEATGMPSSEGNVSPVSSIHSQPAVFVGPPAGDRGSTAVSRARSAAGVVAGLTIGVPVRICRDMKHEVRRMAGTLRGDMGNQFGLTENVFVAGLSIPYGLASGLIMGGIRGTERAFSFGASRPFSRESLGLADPEN